MSDIVRVCDALDSCYGRKEWSEREGILDELIRTILSQNTTAANCHEAFRRLSARFPKWEDVRRARTEDIVESIRVGGLANRKAPRIVNILNEIHASQGSLDLEWIADLPDSKALDYLMRFDGVGRKTAACVLMFALGRPAMPVDTHVYRVSKRLGLIGDVTVEQAHHLLQRAVPKDRVYSLHVNAVAHGRQVCTAHHPKCEICVLRKECGYVVREAEARR
jgi:endonuclease-3